MRLLLGIFLLGCLILPFVGTYIWLQQERADLKHSVFEKLEEGIAPKELVTLVVPETDLSELRWEHEREFEYKGQMYDVVEKKIQGDTVLFICWWDHEETRLKEEMKKLLAGQHQDFPLQNEQQQRIDTFGKNLFIISSMVYVKNGWDDFHKKICSSLICGHASAVLTPPTPPPDWS